jgi:hypothetical protein
MWPFPMQSFQYYASKSRYENEVMFTVHVNVESDGKHHQTNKLCAFNTLGFYVEFIYVNWQHVVFNIPHDETAEYKNVCPLVCGRQVK